MLSLFSYFFALQRSHLSNTADKSSLRIVLLITMGIERPSGIRYFHLARELVRHGHAVRILALHPDLPNCPQRRFVRDSVEVWYVGQMHARKSGSVPIRMAPWQLLYVLVRSTLGMVWGILCSPADIYHLGKPQPINGLAALIGVMLLRRQCFYVDCDDDEVGSNRLGAGWQRAVFAFWQWLLPRLAAGVTVNTHFLAERLRREGVEPIAYVPNGVDPQRFQRPPVATLQVLRAALGLEGCKVIAYMGTLALHNHPVDMLLDAFAAIAGDMPDARLLLIGGGEDLPVLRKRVAKLGLKDRVLFTGHLPQHSALAYLALADVSVDPVRDDDVARARSPLKVLESQMLGVPVVTGDVGDRAEMLANGTAGVLVPSDDVAALAQGLHQILENEDRRNVLSQTAQQHAQHYTWQVLVTRWEAVYGSI